MYEESSLSRTSSSCEEEVAFYPGKNNNKVVLSQANKKKATMDFRQEFKT